MAFSVFWRLVFCFCFNSRPGRGLVSALRTRLIFHTTTLSGARFRFLAHTLFWTGRMLVGFIPRFAISEPIQRCIQTELTAQSQGQSSCRCSCGTDPSPVFVSLCLSLAPALRRSFLFPSSKTTYSFNTEDAGIHSRRLDKSL